MRRVAQESYAAVGNILRFSLPRGAAKFLIDGVDVDEAIFVETEFRFCLQDAAYGGVKAFARDAAGLHRGL